MNLFSKVSLFSALLWLFYRAYWSGEGDVETLPGRRLKSIYQDYPDPRNYHKNMEEWRAISLEIDRNKSLKENDNQYNSKTSHVKMRLAEEMYSKTGFVKLVHPMTGQHNRNITREKGTEDVVMLMTHLYPFPTQCLYERASKLRRQIRQYGAQYSGKEHCPFYIAHFLPGHNRTHLHSAIFDPYNNVDIEYWAPRNTHVWGKLYGWELKWTVFRWLSAHTRYPRTWLVEDDVYLQDISGLLAASRQMPQKLLSTETFNKNYSNWPHSSQARVHGKYCFRKEEGVAWSVSLALARVDRDLARKFSDIFLSKEYTTGLLTPTRSKTYGHFEALLGCVLKKEVEMFTELGHKTSLVYASTPRTLRGEFHLGSWGRFFYMPCAMSFKRLNRTLAFLYNPVDFKASAGVNVTAPAVLRTSYNHPVKCCNPPVNGTFRKSLNGVRFDLQKGKKKSDTSWTRMKEGEEAGAK
jgi:hypothetical protein